MGLLSRRRLLIGGAAAALLGASTAAASLHLGPPARGAQVLTPHELVIVEHIAAVMFPAGYFPVDGVTAGVAARVDRILSDVTDSVRTAGFRYVLRTLEWGTFASRGLRFTELDPARQLAVLEAWSDPTVLARRVAGDGLKVVLGMAYFAHPEVLGALGWHSTCGSGPA